MNGINIQDVIKLVNDARKALGMEPVDDLPKGRRKQPCLCPVARALSTGERHAAVSATAVAFGVEAQAQVVASTWERPRASMSVQLPPPLSDFVVAFDRGELPQYEGERG